MKTLKTIGLLLALALCVKLAAAEAPSVTLPELAAQIQTLEKQQVVLTGQIVGACKSGCKMWVAAGDYKEGDLFTLVRAKDDAFKFDTQATGKQVVMHGFAVASYMDYCADAEKGGKAAEEAAAEKAAGTCAAPVKLNDAAAATTAEATGEASAEASGEKKLQDLTFFATSVEYK